MISRSACAIHSETFSLRNKTKRGKEEVRRNNSKTEEMLADHTSTKDSVSRIHRFLTMQ